MKRTALIRLTALSASAPTHPQLLAQSFLQPTPHGPVTLAPAGASSSGAGGARVGGE